MNTITPEQLQRSVFTMIGKDWLLITAKKGNQVNTMTASWGGMGILWNKQVAFLFIRPQRYTKEFVDASDTLSLSFYDESYRKQLSYLGTVSGRDEDKIKKANLHITFDEDTPYFEEANTILIGRKLFTQQLDKESFLNHELRDSNYPNDDYHWVYVVEIEKVLTK